MLLLALTTYGQQPVGIKAPQDPTLQDRIQPTPAGYVFQAGDTIVISKNQTVYLTGEEPSPWVYNVRHTIYSIGGKRFPNGILVNGIMSWVEPENAYLAGLIKELPAEEPVKEEPVVEAAPAPVEKAPVVETTPAVETTPVVEPEPEPEPEPVVEEPVAEPEPVVEEAPVVEEPAEEPVKEKKHFNHRFTIGARGGVASLMHDAPNFGNWKAGFDAMLDLQYGFYGFSQKQDMYGFIVGVSAGYARSGLSNSYNDQYTVNTSDGTVDYKVSAANAKEQDGQVMVEIPLMFSMVMHNGFFLNVGPRVALPLAPRYNQTLTDANVEAYFVEEGVTVTNEAITGKLEGEQKSDGSWKTSKVNILLSGELGYEWKFANGHSLGLGAYANYCVNPNKKSDDGTKLIQVTPPSAEGVAVPTVNSITDSYAQKLNFFDAGIKIAYHFNWFK